MKTQALSRFTGILFILGAILVNIPYALLIANFDYPGILRAPVPDILTAFAQGGNELIFTWLAFAWTGLPLLLAIILLPKVLPDIDTPLLSSATTFGVIGAIVQMVGLLRWVFVVPVLAHTYTDPGASPATRAAITVTFQAMHQFSGVLLGEHLGQAYTIVWMVMLSVILLRTKTFRPWLGWLGMVAAAVYVLAQAELLATVVPSFPQIDLAGLVGSLLWLIWMTVLGIFLLKKRVVSLASV